MTQLATEVFSPAGESRGSVLAVHGFGGSTEQNWVRTGWVKKLTQPGFQVVAVTLPLHSGNEKDEQPPTLIADFQNRLRALAADLPRPVYGLGFSYGAHLVMDMMTGGQSVLDAGVLVGMDGTNHLGQAVSELEGQVTDGIFASVFAGSTVPSHTLLTFAQAAAHQRFIGGKVQVPTLLIFGENDQLASNVKDFAAQLEAAGSDITVCCVAGRDHISALTSGLARSTAADFLASLSQ